MPNAWMFSTPGHPLWLYVLALAATRAAEPFIEYATGPILLYDAYQYYSRDSASGRGATSMVGRLAARVGAHMPLVLPPVTVLPPGLLYPFSWAVPEERVVAQDIRNRLSRGEPIDNMVQTSPEAYALTYWYRSWSR